MYFLFSLKCFYRCCFEGNLLCNSGALSCTTVMQCLCDGWSLFLALSGGNASVPASTPTPTINFTFYLLDKHLYKLAAGS